MTVFFNSAIQRFYGYGFRLSEYNKDVSEKVRGVCHATVDRK
jgi:hypothetical protein